MARPLTEYHSLEDGELNRLWYEEEDPLARDAFQLRWWLGGDPIGGKDLLSNYHKLIYHRCFENGLVAEEHHIQVFRSAVTQLVANFPAHPIESFEDVLLPHIETAIQATRGQVEPLPDISDAEIRSSVDSALAELNDEGSTIREWLDLGAEDKTEDEFSKALVALKHLAKRVYGEPAKNHPLVRTDLPAPRSVDDSVKAPHLTAQQVFAYAHRSGDVSAAAKRELEWCRPCRELAVGTLLLLRRMRQAHGGTVPDLPEVAPEFDASLQAAFLEVAPEPPKPSAAASNPSSTSKKGASASSSNPGPNSGGGGKGLLIAVVILAALAAIIFTVMKLAG